MALDRDAYGELCSTVGEVEAAADPARREVMISTLDSGEYLTPDQARELAADLIALADAADTPQG